MSKQMQSIPHTEEISQQPRPAGQRTARFAGIGLECGVLAGASWQRAPGGLSQPHPLSCILSHAWLTTELSCWPEKEPSGKEGGVPTALRQARPPSSNVHR